MENQPNVIVVNQSSNLAGILAIVFAIIGIFVLAIVFVPLAILLAAFATYKVIKKTGSLIVAIIAWLLIIVAIATSPTLWAIFGISTVASAM